MDKYFSKEYYNEFGINNGRLIEHQQYCRIVHSDFQDSKALYYPFVFNNKEIYNTYYNSQGLVKKWRSRNVL